MELELENAPNSQSDLLANIANSLLISPPSSKNKSMSFASMHRGETNDAYRTLDAGPLDHGSQVNSVRKSIEELQGDLAIATRLVEAIGTKRDTPDQRQKMTSTIERCAAAARSISQQLERLDASDRNKKQVKQKLQGDFMKLRSDFQNVSTLAKQRSAQAAKNSKNSAPSNSSRFGSQADHDEERSLLQDQAEKAAERDRMMQQEVEYNNARILEQQEQFKIVERDVAQIEEIFKDLSMLVTEQGIQIDNIEQNIVNSRDSAKAAHENLVEASEYQKAARTKMCWCALFFAIVALVLVLWLTNSF